MSSQLNSVAGATMNLAANNLTNTTSFEQHKILTQDELQQVRFYEKIGALWLTSSVFSCVITPLLVYTLFSLIYHGYKTSTLVGCGGTSLADRPSTIVNSLTITATAFVALFVSSSLPQIYSLGDPFCAIQGDIQTIFFAIGITVTYCALWYRIYAAFYTTTEFKSQLSKGFKIANGFSLLVLLLSVLTFFVVRYVEPSNVSKPFWCEFPNNSSFNKTINLIPLEFLTVVCFGFLLCLFMYCFFRHNSLQKDPEYDAVIKVLKNSAIAACVCVVAGLVNVSVNMILYREPTTYIYNISLSINLVVNIFAVILSSSNWGQKLMPFSCTCKRQSSSEKFSTPSLTVTDV